MEFDPLEYWLTNRDNAETALIIAQKEIHRLLGNEILDNVITVDFRPIEPDAA
jgi:hypothetical protein